MADANQIDQNLRNAAYGWANDNYGFNKANQWTNYYHQLEQQYVNILNEKAKINYKMQSDMKGWMDRVAIRQHGLKQERRAYEKSLQIYGQQTGFNSIGAEIALNDAARAYQDTLTSLGFQDRDLLLKYHEGGETAAYETEGLTQRINQAEEVAQLQVRGAKLNKDIAQAEAALDKLGLRQGLDETRAKAAFKMQDLRKEYLQKEGAQRNLGQAGRSAGKAIQALLASHGATQAAIVDSISRADASEALNFRRISEGLENTANKTNLRYAEIAKNLSHTVDQAQHAQAGIGMKFSQLGRRTEFGREQVAASRDSAELQYGADQQRILMDKFQADLSAWGSLQLKPEATPVESLPIIQPEQYRSTLPKPGDAPLPQMGVDTVEGKSALPGLVKTAVGGGLMLASGGVVNPATSSALFGTGLNMTTSGAMETLF